MNTEKYSTVTVLKETQDDLDYIKESTGVPKTRIMHTVVRDLADELRFSEMTPAKRHKAIAKDRFGMDADLAAKIYDSNQEGDEL